MGLIRLLFSDPLLFTAVAVLLLYSIIAHEVAHGFVALLFGDTTAKRYGRLTFNPLPHIDPIGALMLFFVGFGWAKPVPVNYDALGNSRLALIAVSLAGCITNILIAFVAIALLQLQSVAANPAVVDLLSIVARINVILGAFNLIPIPPLDGSKVLMGFLPIRMQQTLAEFEQYGFYILIFLLFTGVLNPVIAVLQNTIYHLASATIVFLSKF
jgi:Zn-dependent protease